MVATPPRSLATRAVPFPHMGSDWVKLPVISVLVVAVIVNIKMTLLLKDRYQNNSLGIFFWSQKVHGSYVFVRKGQWNDSNDGAAFELLFRIKFADACL